MGYFHTKYAYFGPSRAQYIVYNRLYSPIMALQTPSRAARDRLVLLQSSNQCLYGPLGLIAANLTLQTTLALARPQTTIAGPIALVVPQQATGPARPPQQATTTIDQQQEAIPIQQTKQASGSHGMVVYSQGQGQAQQNNSLQVYFSLGLPEVQWRHDFYQYKNFQSRK